MKRVKNTNKIMLIFLGTVLLASSCATTSKENNVQKAAAHYQLGVSYLNDNNIQPAFVEFQTALELDPNNKEVLNAVGIIYLMKLEDHRKATEYFQKALKVDKNFSEASNNLGIAFEKSGKYNEAIEAFRAALSNPLYRNADRAFSNLGRAYYRARRFDDAIEAYKEALRRFSDFYLPYYGLALCYNAKGRYGDAAAALRKAIEIDPAYKGDKEKVIREMQDRKLLAGKEDEKDIEDWLEIMNY